MKLRDLIIRSSAVAVAGCAGKVEYTPPRNASADSNAVTVERSLDDAWKTSVAALSSRVFVINTIDKSSGILNISYSGDPLKYIDCGRIMSYVKNIRGDRTYDFPGASANENYEVMPDMLYAVSRRVALEGRANILFAATGPTTTTITVNTKYVVTRSVNAIRADGVPSLNQTDVISFNSGSSATFPGAATQATTCTPNGQFEREILGAMTGR